MAKRPPISLLRAVTCHLDIEEQVSVCRFRQPERTARATGRWHSARPTPGKPRPPDVSRPFQTRGVGAGVRRAANASNDFRCSAVLWLRSNGTRCHSAGRLLRAHGSREPAPAPSRTAATHRGRHRYVQFQLLARLAARGQLTMTELADGVVYSRSGLTYQAACCKTAASSPAIPAPTTNAPPWSPSPTTAGPSSAGSCPATSRSPACCSTPCPTRTCTTSATS